MGAGAGYAVAVPDMYFACTQLLNLVVAPASPPSVSESPLQEQWQRRGIQGKFVAQVQRKDNILGGLAGQET